MTADNNLHAPKQAGDHIRYFVRRIAFFIFAIPTLVGCQTLFSVKAVTEQGLTLPYIKNTPNECYYLDEFMPVPNNMVTGKTGSLSLRYYTYNAANYKEWTDHQIILSFYSKDGKCWSLYEEYYVVE